MSGKTEKLNFKIEPEIKKAFVKFCEDNCTTPSQKLYAFVHQTIKHSGKKISLHEFKERKL